MPYARYVAGENCFKMFFKKITMQHYIIQLYLVVIDNIGKGLIMDVV